MAGAVTEVTVAAMAAFTAAAFMVVAFTAAEFASAQHFTAVAFASRTGAIFIGGSFMDRAIPTHPITIIRIATAGSSGPTTARAESAVIARGGAAITGV